MPHTTPSSACPPALPLAAIVQPAGDEGAVDCLVAAFCLALQHQGLRVGGVLQRRPAGGGKGLLLVDVCTGQAYPASQDLGPQSRSCCVDPGGVAQASGVLRQALADRVALAVTNRFGELEASGGGFAAEIGALVQAGIPVLTVVAEKHLGAWRRFTGAVGQELPARLPALHGWFAQAGRCGAAP